MPSVSQAAPARSASSAPVNAASSGKHASKAAESATAASNARAAGAPRPSAARQERNGARVSQRSASTASATMTVQTIKPASPRMLPMAAASLSNAKYMTTKVRPARMADKNYRSRRARQRACTATAPRVVARASSRCVTPRISCRKSRKTARLIVVAGWHAWCLIPIEIDLNNPNTVVRRFREGSIQRDKVVRSIIAIVVVFTLGGCSVLDQFQFGTTSFDPNKIYLDSTTVVEVAPRDTYRYACVGILTALRAARRRVRVSLPVAAMTLDCHTRP